MNKLAKSIMYIKAKVRHITRKTKETIERHMLNIITKKRYSKLEFRVNSNITSIDYLHLAKKCRQKKFPLIDSLEQRMGFALSNIWLDELALITQVTIKENELNYQHGRVIYSTLRKYIQEHLKNEASLIRILEIGTARGFSAVCMSKAVLDANVNGIIITIDPLPHDQKIYWNCIADINGKKSRRDLLKKYRKELENIIFIQGYSPDSIDKLGMSRINFAFVDGMHNYTSVLEEYNMIKRNQNAGDIIIFDDIQAAKYSEVGKLIKEIELSGEYTLQEVWSSPNRGYAIMTNKVNKTKSDG